MLNAHWLLTVDLFYVGMSGHFSTFKIKNREVFGDTQGHLEAPTDLLSMINDPEWRKL